MQESSYNKSDSQIKIIMEERSCYQGRIKPLMLWSHNYECSHIILCSLVYWINRGMQEIEKNRE